MTTLKILQGANQIGGTVILIEGEKTKLLLDFGVPLTDSAGNSLNIDLKKVNIKDFLHENPDFNSKETLIFLSHAHPDHFGLLKFVDKKTPIYTSQITKELLLKESELMFDNIFTDINLRVFRDVVETHDFKIKKYEVNHSIAGALAFEIEDKKSGKRIVYTGDLRLHGRDGDKITREIGSSPDYLIVEGTTLSRNSEEIYFSELDIEDKMYDIFSENKLSIVSFSPFNSDRLESVYNACIRAGKTFVIDPYTAYIMKSLKTRTFLSYDSYGIKVYCVSHPYSTKIFKNKDNKEFGLNKISMDEITANPEKYVVKDNSRTTKFIADRVDLNSANIVYSYWEGYLNRKHLNKYSKNPLYKYKNKFIKIHTSGHIYQTDLKNFTNVLKPKKIIPVHTISNDVFKKLYRGKIVQKKEISIN